MRRLGIVRQRKARSRGEHVQEHHESPADDSDSRGNLPASEPKRLEKWEQEHIYEQVLEKNKDGKPFVLHDGPPYANGPIHIGHAFNKVLKDFVNKSHAQRGYFTPYVPGGTATASLSSIWSRSPWP